jgi:hypothetical protein
MDSPPDDFQLPSPEDILAMPKEVLSTEPYVTTLVDQAILALRDRFDLKDRRTLRAFNAIKRTSQGKPVPAAGLMDKGFSSTTDQYLDWARRVLNSQLGVGIPADSLEEALPSEESVAPSTPTLLKPEDIDSSFLDNLAFHEVEKMLVPPPTSRGTRQRNDNPPTKPPPSPEALSWKKSSKIILTLQMLTEMGIDILDPKQVTLIRREIKPGETDRSGRPKDWKRSYVMIMIHDQETEQEAGQIQQGKMLLVTDNPQFPTFVLHFCVALKEAESYFRMQYPELRQLTTTGNASSQGIRGMDQTEWKEEIKRLLTTKNPKRTYFLNHLTGVIVINGEEYVGLNAYSKHTTVTRTILPDLVERAKLKPLDGVLVKSHASTIPVYKKSEVDSILPRFLEADGTILLTDPVTEQPRLAASYTIYSNHRRQTDPSFPKRDALWRRLKRGRTTRLTPSNIYSSAKSSHAAVKTLYWVDEIEVAAR